ncbi:MAG: Ig-like domain-containing protein [Hyalangium sp.]|uniref:Ig-like domain-containing protein n=1 Tax=Hyalangium sp. TaxID=2028555 RepID=UPI0038998824
MSSKLLRAGKSAVPERYIVVFEDSGDHSLRASPLEVSKASGALAAQYGGSVRQVFSHALKGYSAAMSEAQALRLSEDPRVRYVEQDRLFTLHGTQTNPDWGLDRIDQQDTNYDNLYHYEYTGAGIHVYVLDTGVRSTHSEFAGRMGAGFDSVGDGLGTEDCQGHGTHVAGSIGGTISGVAKGVTIHPVRVLSCAGEGTGEQVLAGMDWIVANHVSPAVVNMSLGGEAEQSIDDAVAQAVAAGIVYVVAAGNDSADACTESPARAPQAITVGATDYFDSLTYYSNFGTCVDMFAPGDEIESAWYTSDTATEVLSGTSMATPHVTGAAALFLEGHPTATPADVQRELVNRGTHNAISYLDDASPNVLLYTGCMGSTDAVPPQVTLTAPAGGATLTGTVTLSATASDDVLVSKVEFYVNGQLVGTDTSAPYSISWNSADEASGPATITARAFDGGCNSQDSSVSVTIHNAGRASYDATLHAPFCSEPSSQCDSGSLLAGRGILGPELHAPNTLNNSCLDGNEGYYQLDPSLERIKVIKDDGSLLAGGKQVRVEVTFNAGFDSNLERLELYGAGDALNPVWTHLTTISPLDFGPNTLSANVTLPRGTLQAIRGVYRYGGVASPCPGGTMDDVDDLVFAVSQEADTQPPTATLTAPAAGATISKTVTLTAAASDNFGVTQVEFYDGTALLGTATGATFNLSWDTRTAANGAHSLTARAYDAAGLTGTSPAVNVTVNNDATPPTVAFTAPAAGATLTGSYTVTATATDNVSVTKVELYDGATLINYDSTAPYSFLWNTRQVPNGNHTLTLKAYDPTGNVGTATLTVRTDNDLIPPTVALTAPAQGSTLTGTVTFSANASDDHAVTQVTFYVGNIQAGSVYSAPYNITFNTRSFPNGAKVITAKAYDAAANVTTSSAVNVTFDNDVTAPTTTVTAPADGSTVSGTVTITATASDDRGVVSRVEFYANGVKLATATSAPYSYAWDTTKWSTGAYTLKTYAFDPAGNQATSNFVRVTVTR